MFFDVSLIMNPKCNYIINFNYFLTHILPQGDGYCDKACNVASCNFDFPDCINGSNTNNAGFNGGQYKVCWFDV